MKPHRVVRPSTPNEFQIAQRFEAQRRIDSVVNRIRFGWTVSLSTILGLVLASIVRSLVVGYRSPMVLVIDLAVVGVLVWQLHGLWKGLVTQYRDMPSGAEEEDED